MNIQTPVRPPELRAEAGARRMAHSALTAQGVTPSLPEFLRMVEKTREHLFTTAEPVPLSDLQGWRHTPDGMALAHHSGGFFRVVGLSVDMPDGPVPRWSQPIIDQPETGILGILVKEFGGVPHLLMQLKPEPGNRNGLQLSPTVQATRSNYTGVHRGRGVPYLEYFLDPPRVLADVRQSEQGAWFLRKRNRNMVVETGGDVEVREGFHWLTLGQVNALLAVDDTVNMDSRTVLSCLPLTRTGAVGGDAFGAALDRSLGPDADALHPTTDILSWITGARAAARMATAPAALRDLPGWHRVDGRISHEEELFFDVIGVRVEASGREVDHWTQPMIAARGTGLVALLVADFGGVLHVLLNLRAEPGLIDGPELGPTVQYTSDTYARLPAAARPALLDRVLDAPPESIRFDAVQSDEGGRFYHTVNRHLVIETEPLPEPPGHRWVTLRQTQDLLRHSNYLNVQARSALACLRGLLGRSGG
ncbi:NDP-hexose 2,3-dehydratase family protein [Streptomyces amakusaensis]|uniref:NDP-hexose 2,3-dehydratase family protein n=1 Tax=Streptomyces amakusaensis TaxID=67271 RepID=A0ABW0AFJ2_9ACTN